MKAYLITTDELALRKALSTRARLTWQNMVVQWKECEVERNIGEARVRLEDCEETEKGSDHKKRLRSQSNCQPADVACQMQPENAKEKCSEGIKNFDEEIPPQADVGREIRYQELEAVSRRNELPRTGDDV